MKTYNCFETNKCVGKIESINSIKVKWCTWESWFQEDRENIVQIMNYSLHKCNSTHWTSLDELPFFVLSETHKRMLRIFATHWTMVKYKHTNTQRRTGVTTQIDSYLWRQSLWSRALHSQIKRSIHWNYLILLFRFSPSICKWTLPGKKFNIIAYSSTLIFIK